MPINGFFLSQMQRLQASVLDMGELAGRLVGDAVAAFVAKDAVLAKEVIARDEELDRLEDEHEELTIQIIALNQPVARDLRLLIALLHVNASIERVGDLAGNIAGSAIRLSDKPTIKPYVDIPRNYELVRGMWDDALRCFSALDVGLAQQIRESDDHIDRANEETIRRAIQISTDDPKQIYQATNIIGVSKALERIADIAVDVSDEVIYARRGELRHARTQRRTA